MTEQNKHCKLTSTTSQQQQQQQNMHYNVCILLTPHLVSSEVELVLHLKAEFIAKLLQQNLLENYLK